MKYLLYLLERHLLLLVIITSLCGLFFPQPGILLSGVISPLLAVLMLIISMTFDAKAVRDVMRTPLHQVWALLLVYGPMSLTGLLTGRLFFGTGALALGQALVGTLPTDISAPLLVLLARGNVALAAVLNAINTALSPFIVPSLFLALTGVELVVPLSQVILELSLIVLLPTLIGVSLRTRYPHTIQRYDHLYPPLGSALYLLLLLAVIGPNAQIIFNYGPYALKIALAALILNLAGYAIGMTTRLFTTNREVIVAYLFTVSKKEFTIAAAFISISGLPIEYTVPAVFFAVIQMITSPIAARLLR